jgi:DNA-binding NarL/FixJ family response regulator
MMKIPANPLALIVDDSIDNIHMLKDVLESESFTVAIALDGAQALTISQTMTPDIILLDAVMPRMDGFETCRRLKQNPELQDTPIIFMTGLSDTEHVVMGLHAGGVDYVTKPINNDELVARMRVHLSNARLTQSARSALDTAGHYLLAVDNSGQLLWATPQVHQLLQDGAGAPQEQAIRQALCEWLEHKPEAGRKLSLSFLPKPLVVEFLAQVDHKENLLRLSHAPRASASTEKLREVFAVTGREADVLLWIAQGKTNREIGQILDMSPRTVNKHLEQIFRKLGVENRTAAAAVALKSLAGNH